MKPRTKLEKRVTGLSGKLSAVTEVQKEWRKNRYKAMKATSYMKQHKANEFYVKKVRGYYMVIDGYDMSMASLEDTEEAANKMAAELNAMRNNRLNIA